MPELPGFMPQPADDRRVPVLMLTGFLGPLVNTTPFGSEPGVATSEGSADDTALFGALWPQGDVVKLDATVDRRVLRQQRDRFGTLGYEFAPLFQDWHLAMA